MEVIDEVVYEPWKRRVDKAFPQHKEVFSGAVKVLTLSDLSHTEEVQSDDDE